MALHPTLWRTCRVLAGPTRLRLLRRVVQKPGQTVQALADALDLGKSRASQELRRLQSRGLILAKRNAAQVAYHPVSDPLVSTARPLLEAMKTAYARQPPVADAGAIAAATALAYPRRIELVRELLQTPRTTSELSAMLQIPWVSLNRHLRVLHRLNLARNICGEWHVTPNRHPLTRTLIQLLREEPAASPE